VASSTICGRHHPYLVYDQLEFDVPVGSVGDCYDRYLVRLEEMRQSVRILHQCLDRLPGGPENESKEPINVPDYKVVLPPKEKVLTRMEELIHQFILVTQGVNAPPGEVYFAAENPKGQLVLHSQQGRWHATPAENPLAVLRESQRCSLLLPGHMVGDTVAILGSLDFVMGECDR